MPKKLKLNTVTTGNALELADLIEDNSVDLIACDPVYDLIWQYEWLAHTAARILKPGRSVIAQSGQIYTLQCENAMQHPKLTARPRLNEHFTGGWIQIHVHKVQRASVPYLWLEKGEFDGYRKWPPTSFFGQKDKGGHKWGDGERGWAKLVYYLSRPGGLVVDFFAGSGTIGAVCKKLDRPYIGIEIDPETARYARKRIAEAQPPIMALTYEQESAAFMSDPGLLKRRTRRKAK